MRVCVARGDKLIRLFVKIMFLKKVAPMEASQTRSKAMQGCPLHSLIEHASVSDLDPTCRPLNLISLPPTPPTPSLWNLLHAPHGFQLGPRSSLMTASVASSGIEATSLEKGPSR